MQQIVAWCDLRDGGGELGVFGERCLQLRLQVVYKSRKEFRDGGVTLT
jgi:hypothetical protein